MTDNRWPILKLNQVYKIYDLKGQQSVQALQNINLALYPGNVWGLSDRAEAAKAPSRNV